MRIAVQQGGSTVTVRAVAPDCRFLDVCSPVPLAPGSPVRLRATDHSIGIEGRVVSARKMGSDAFAVRLRLINVRRADRPVLLKAIDNELELL